MKYFEFDKIDIPAYTKFQENILLELSNKLSQVKIYNSKQEISKENKVITIPTISEKISYTGIQDKRIRTIIEILMFLYFEITQEEFLEDILNLETEFLFDFLDKYLLQNCNITPLEFSKKSKEDQTKTIIRFIKKLKSSTAI